MGRKNPFGTIVEIGDILVSEDVILEYFACDYPVCKGKCCIIGDSGAPLKEEELDPIEVNYDAFAPLMRPEGRQAVEERVCLCLCACDTACVLRSYDHTELKFCDNHILYRSYDVVRCDSAI